MRATLLPLLTMAALPVAAAVASLIQPSLAGAQSLTVVVGASSSDYRELRDPIVVGAAIRAPLISWLQARVDFRRHADNQTWERSSCEGLVPPGEPCPVDVFSSDYRMSSLAGGLELRVPVWERISIGAAAQRSAYWLSGVWQGAETGSRSGEAPDRRFDGWALSASIEVQLVRHLSGSVSARRDDPEFNDCGADAYFPFCRQRDIHSMELGFTLRR